jgi:hypothetical protein
MAQTVQPQTYLQLCNTLITKAGISGSQLGTTLNQTGEMGRVVNWINEAWLEIQELSDTWDWLAKDFTFNTTTGQSAYTLAQIGITDFASWNKQSFRVYFTSVGVRSEVFLEWLDWPQYRDTYLYGNLRLTTGMPLHIARRPEDQSLNLGLSPDANGYTIVGRYFSQPTTFTADSDTPSMPARFHNLIVYRAMQMYGKYEAASEVLQAGYDQFKPMMKRMQKDQMEPITVGTPLI